MKKIIRLSLLLLTLFSFRRSAQKAFGAQAAEGKKDINVSEFVLEHLADSYEWHITTWNGKPISVHLPVIVKGKESGWHVFSSERLEEAAHQGKDYQGFFLRQNTITRSTRNWPTAP